MKLPTLWIAAAFATGIAFTGFSRSPSLGAWLPPALTAVAVAAMTLAGVLLWRRRTAAAWAAVLVAWFALGGLASGIERNSLPADHVTRLIAAGTLDSSEALRWRGRLRENPSALPWGTRFTINLEQVEVAGQTQPISGGLRVNLYRDSRSDPAAFETLVSLRAGDRVEALARARPPRDYLDPGAFDVRGYLAHERIDLLGTLRSADLMQVVDHPEPAPAQRLARARGVLLARIDKLFADHPERAAVLRAMLLGDRNFVDSQVVLEFQKTSAYHVLVVAGLHVGALAVFLFWICRKLRFSVSATSLVTLATLACYVGLVQDRTPILRAALMAALYICARPLFRRVELVNTVALAALVLLIARPSSLADSSFQLSFLAAGVIAALALPWMHRTSGPYRAGLRHLGDVTRDGAFPPKIAQFRIEMRWAAEWLSHRLPARIAARAQSLLVAPVLVGLRLWEVVLLSLVIQWGMLPMLAQDFHRVSMAGPVSNIPAVLLTGLIVPLGFLALGLSFVWMRLAAIVARLASVCAGALLASVAWFSHLPRVSYRIPGPPLWLLVAFFVALVCLAAAARARDAKQANRNVRRQLPPPIHAAEWTAFATLAALTVLVAMHPFAPRFDRGKLEVDVLDVGQGDSIFVSFPRGRTMLVDGGGQAGSEWVGGYRSGPDVGEEAVSPFLWTRGLKTVDVVALTHAHHDHIDGLRAVLDNFRVGELWVGRDVRSRAFDELLAEARSRGVRIIHQTEGANFSWDGVTGEVLWPPQEDAAAEASNDDSMVLRLSDGHIRFLLSGDVQKKAEEQLVHENAPLAADFLKVPHHGSKTSSTPDFLAAVAPRVAVVSAGEGNPFGHPAESTVARYQAAGVQLLRTDLDGEVTGWTDGATLQVRWFTETHPR